MFRVLLAPPRWVLRGLRCLERLSSDPLARGKSSLLGLRRAAMDCHSEELLWASATTCANCFPMTGEGRAASASVLVADQPPHGSVPTKLNVLGRDTRRADGGEIVAGEVVVLAAKEQRGARKRSNEVARFQDAIADRQVHTRPCAAPPENASAGRSGQREQRTPFALAISGMHAEISSCKGATRSSSTVSRPSSRRCRRSWVR